MQIFRLASAAPSLCDTVPEGAIFLLGCFDGVHVGHKALLEQAAALAEKDDRPVVVWSLESSHKASAEQGLLTTWEEKLALLASMGARYVIRERFEDIRSLDGQDFFRSRIAQPFSPYGVVCGENFRFGKGASCSAADLAVFAEEKGIRCAVLPLRREENSQIISSTRIRHLLLEGNADRAHALLGRPYSVTAPILHGKALGRTMGFPTVNQQIPAEKVVPAYGVYACTVTFEKDGKEHTLMGVCNAGSRPTVNGDRANVNLETYILDFSDDLYGVSVTTRFYHRIRGEVTFEDVPSLFGQIRRDAEEARALLEDLLPSP